MLFSFIFFPFQWAGTIYIVLFGILILSGYGLPIPEEISLLLGGYLAYLEYVDFWLVSYVLIIGIVVSDVIGYCLGRFFSRWVWERVFGRFITSRHFLERGETYFEKYGDLVVIVSRPLVGIRVAVPILAGHFKMNFAKFLLFDFLVAIPWTFLLVFISFQLGLGLDAIFAIEDWRYIIFGMSILVVGMFVGAWYFWRKMCRKRALVEVEADRNEL